MVSLNRKKKPKAGTWVWAEIYTPVDQEIKKLECNIIDIGAHALSNICKENVIFLLKNRKADAYGLIPS